MPTARTIGTRQAVVHTDALPPRQRSLFAAQWFAQVAENVRIAAIGVRPQRVLEQLLGAPLRRDPARLRFERLALADATLATACADGADAGWAILDENAPLLERALLSVTDGDHPHIAARRFLDRVRYSTERDDDSVMNIRRFSAERPLRMWLVDRLLGESSAEMRRLTPRSVGTSVRLRLAFERIESKREIARAMVDAMARPSGVERLIGDLS